MEGLECTSLSVKEWREDNDFSRLDSEYQSKAYRASIRRVKAFGALQLKDDSPEIIHPIEIRRRYVDGDGVWFLRAQNVRPLRIDRANRVAISAGDSNLLTRNHIRLNDLLITRTGANRGDCAIYDRQERAVASSHTFLLRPQTLNRLVVAVFLNGYFGRTQVSRGVYGGAQPEIAPYYLRHIWIPKVGAKLVARIARVYATASSNYRQSEAKSREASDTLVAVLGLEEWRPDEPLGYAARLADVLRHRRFDAQFYAPRFASLRAAHEAKFELQYLHGLVMRGRTVPYSDSGTIPVIRSGDLSDISDEAKLLKADEGAPVFFLEKGDVLISSIGFGSIGKVQVFDREGLYGTVSEVTVVRQTQLNPYYLAAYLRSEVGQIQIGRYITGATGQLHLYPRAVESIFVPVLPADKQIEFEHMYKASNRLKSSGRWLLRAAIRAVETAIEDGEVAAMACLDQIEEGN